MFFDQKISVKLSYYYILYLVLAATLIGLDYYQKLSTVKNIIHPPTRLILYTVHTPINKCLKYYQQLIQTQTLYRSYQTLQDNYAKLQIQTHHYAEVERENQYLHRLFKSKQNLKKYNITLARPLHVTLNTNVCEILLDPFSNISFKKRQAILDLYGVIGQIIEILPVPKILRIDDKRSSIPVEIERNSIKGILAGQGFNQPLALKYLCKTQDVQVGDRLVTSGLGGVYPKGYLVGYVSAIDHCFGDFYLKVSATPAAALNKNQLLLAIGTTS